MKLSLKAIIFVLVFFWCFNSTLLAQPLKDFTPDNVKYLSELTSFFTAASKKRGKDFIDEFSVFWESGQLNENHLKKVYQVSNLLLDKRLKPFPEFENFLIALENLSKKGKMNEDFDTWASCIEGLTKNRRTNDLKEFLEASRNLVADSILYRSGSVIWKADNDNYTFVCDSIPSMTFESVNLICMARGDSSVLRSTKGTYFPTLQKWYGERGTVTWEAVGISPTEVYADLKSFDIKLSSDAYTIDSVVFHNSSFPKPLEGKVSEKIQSASQKEPTYPRFESYDKHLTIKEIIKGVDYEGGFGMQGAEFVGAGSKEEPATLVFYRNSVPVLKTYSTSYSMKPDKITSPKIEVVINLGEDSIIHPNLKLKLIKEDRSMTLLNGEDGTSRVPYQNYYHGISMYFEALYWKIDEPIMELGSLFGSTNRKAKFESLKYYKGHKYDMMQGMDVVHPLIMVKDLTREMDTREFYAEELANFWKMSLTQAITMLINLTYDGFVYYDEKTHYVTVNDKLFDYINARAGKIDYDVISYESVTKNLKNASLNLENFDLSIDGLRQVELSDSQKVVAYPDSSTIVLKKSQNFTFNGTLLAGNLILKGKDFSFDYDTFKIDFEQVDTIEFFARSFEESKSGHRRLVKVKSVMQDAKGTILIDDPSNKSGVKHEEFTQYPILQSHKESFVYYNKEDVLEGAYNQDSFYFKIHPFTIDSLDNYRNEELKFPGFFSSGGILPDFEENLTLQEDYSLGFTRATPPEGYFLYGDEKAKFTNEIILSHKGLQGNGSFEYLSSISTSEAFTFYPDSTVGVGEFLNEEQGEGLEVPKVEGKEAKIVYIPKEESLVASNTKEPLGFFNKEVDLYGELTLTPKGMVGKGNMKFEDVELVSNEYKYKRRIIDADTASFNLNAESVDNLALETKNVNLHIDFDERKGVFKSNGEVSFMEFPHNNYICYMDVFIWDMDQSGFALENSQDPEAAVKKGEEDGKIQINSALSLAKSNFYSVHPKQDSLNFISPVAKYDLKSKVIYCEKVPFIRVADATIVPSDGNVVIKKKAKLDPLEGATLVVNQTTQFHQINNAKIEITSKKEYSGSGEYVYKDETDSEQTIKLKEIKVDTTLQTIASGEIPQSDKFFMSPNFSFYGDVKLEANNEFLLFDGYAKVEHACEGMNKDWVKFKDYVNPKEVFIPLKTAENVEGVEKKKDKYSSGLFMSPDSLGIYSGFMSEKEESNAIEIITGEGYLYFDKKGREYRISNKEKLKERSLPGNYVSLNIDSCTVFGDGKLNLGLDLGIVKLQSIGEIQHNTITNKINGKCAMGISFFFSEPALGLMATDIISSPLATPIDFTQSMFVKSLRESIGLEQADKLVANLSLTGEMKKVPDQMNHSIFLTDVNFVWNRETLSYQSYGTIGVGSIGGKQIFKEIEGKVELIKKRTGDVLQIYLELDKDNWYYFNYERNLLQTISSSEDFNKIIIETKDDKREYKLGKGEDTYMYIFSTPRKKSDFLRRFVEGEEDEE